MMKKQKKWHESRMNLDIFNMKNSRIAQRKVQRVARLVLFLGAFFGESLHASIPLAPARVDASCAQSFVESFLSHYEFSPEGRYVHEYHPFILKKTATSFDQLEEYLSVSGFDLSGRYVILGYEEYAVPPYYTNFKEAKINDEACLKNNAGWSLKLHNRFGFMTGFLFKDCDKIDQGENPVFEHINADLIPIFNDRAAIFQEHAFGEALELILRAQRCVLHAIHKNSSKEVFEWLQKFWQGLYSRAFKVGNKQVAGTQDILFSVEYARHVLSSSLPVRKYFIGPDITYPIEVFSKQRKEVTRHAQSFVKKFVPLLESQDQQSTVYIFCSFVDGVGKSTMLGNIKNWMKYGDNTEEFQHVDNSSSQLAEVFKFKENVYIADLPAQISHFCYKPDGLVYVDAQTAYKSDNLTEVREWIKEHRDELAQKFDQDFNVVIEIIEKEGYFAPQLNDPANPEYAYIKNLILLKKTTNIRWVSFAYNNIHYLFNYENSYDIRFLISLGEVRSEGLKNIEAEQMLFFEGLRFPLPYTYFVEDLKKKLQDAGVKKVVFVDFLSMYPRSSRENVRINYLLQQMALLDKTFDMKQSMYRDFVSGGELLYYLYNQNTLGQISLALKQETLVRLMLFTLIVERQSGDLSGIKLATITSELAQRIACCDQKLSYSVKEQVFEKIKKELSGLEKLYGLSKSFINVQKQSLTKICTFSSILHYFFTHQVKNENINNLWEDWGALVEDDCDKYDRHSDVFVPTTKGALVRLCYTLSSESKIDYELTPFLRMVRSAWYAALANLLYATINEDGESCIQEEAYLVPPVLVQPSPSGNTICVTQPVFDMWEGAMPKHAKLFSTLFNMPLEKRFGEFQGNLYRLDWNSNATHTKLFAFDCDVDKKKKKDGYIPLVTRFVQRYQKDLDFSTVMPAFELCEQLEKSVYWKMDQDSMKKQAAKNGYATSDATGKGEDSRSRADKEALYRSRRKIFLGKPEYKESIRRMIILLVTLEMIAKDPEADIVVRDGNRDDFKAAIKLFEKITLPKYFGVLYKENLFSDYDAVEPYPSWDYWDNLGD